MRDIISVQELTRSDFEELFNKAEKMIPYSKSRINLLEEKILAVAFFEPSTRTRLSFETAIKRLGGDSITIVGEEAISTAKGESFVDTIRMLDRYANVIVVRHQYEGAARLAANIAEAPVINGGDGRQHHPTQTMIDLFTVMKLKGKIDGLVYGVLGDLKYARTANSFVLGLTKFKPRKIYLISPELLKIREETRDVLIKSNTNFEELNDPKEVLSEIDILYVTRVQKERFPDPLEYEKVRGSYKITLDILKHAQSDLKILHPLPKVDEIHPSVDNSKYAAYFLQAAYGVPVRMALLASIFGVDL